MRKNLKNINKCFEFYLDMFQLVNNLSQVNFFHLDNYLTGKIVGHEVKHKKKLRKKHLSRVDVEPFLHAISTKTFAPNHKEIR